MQWTSIIAIYGLFWVLSAFMVLPYGIRATSDDPDVVKVPGQADSAPLNFQPKLILLRATVLSAILFALFYLNYLNGWITPSDINLFGTPPSAQA